MDENDKIALEDQKVLLDETRDRIFSAIKSKGLSQKELATALLEGERRSLLFCDLENQTNDADNHKTELKQI